MLPILHGMWSTAIPSVCHLQELQLGANRLSRLDPVKLVSLTGLMYLDLRENKLQRSEPVGD